MFIERVPKDPDEKIPLEINYKTILRIGETISTAVITAKNRSTGIDTTATMIIDVYSLDDTERVVTQNVEAGTDGEEYIVEFHVVTSEGAKYDGHFVVPVEEFV